MVRYDFRQRYESAEEALQAVRGLSPPSLPWKVLIGVGVAATLAFIILLFSQFRNQTPNFTLYENYNYGIKIKYDAENWIKQEQGDFF